MTLKLVTSEGPPSVRLPIVAIDGPAGAGKSTAARLLAAQLGFKLIDTGALYRSLALQAFDRNIPLDDGPKLAQLCQSIKIQFGTLERTHSEEGVPKVRIFCNGLDVTDAIRTPEMGLAASNVSKLPEVRASLLEMQRTFGREGGIVMEGRDIGTVIFPDAEIKFFLTASVENRARRRCEELEAAGIQVKLEQILRETQQRDEQDSTRAVAPLKQAADAQLIDSTSKSLDEVVAEMAHHVRSYLSK